MIGIKSEKTKKKNQNESKLSIAHLNLIGQNLYHQLELDIAIW